MHAEISKGQGAALQGLLEQTTEDIVLTIDRHGFIEDGSASLREIGYDLSELLLKPHVADLAASEYAQELVNHVRDVMARGPSESGPAEWLEFPVRLPAPDAVGEPGKLPEPATCKRWYALSLRPITDENGDLEGAIGLLRSVERLRALEGEVYSRALIDPLTGLSNRHAFCAGLRRQLTCEEGGMMALFEVDRMRAIFLQYGQRTADEIIWGFAKFLEAMANPEHDLAQFDGERFCVILPGYSKRAARSWVRDVLQTFGSLTISTSTKSPKLSASAGLAKIENSVDWTLRQAELALVMARARGGMQVGECAPPPNVLDRFALG